MAAVKRRGDVCYLSIRPTKRVREFQSVLVVAVGFVSRNSGRKIRRALRNRRRIRKYRNCFSGRTDGKDSQIAVAKITVVSLSLEIRKHLDRTVGIRAKGRSRLHAAVHISHTVVVRNHRIISQTRKAHMTAYRHEHVGMISNQLVPQPNSVSASAHWLVGIQRVTEAVVNTAGKSRAEWISR